MSRATRRQVKRSNHVQRPATTLHATQSASAATTRAGADGAQERGSRRPSGASLAQEGIAAQAPHSVARSSHAPNKTPAAGRYQRLERERRRALLLRIGGAVIIGMLALGVIFYISHGGASGVKAGRAGQYPFEVANPAKGALAPDFTLPATTGGSVRLSDYRGKSVLLYFQEGIGCEGCWTQLKDIQDASGAVQRLDISAVLTITTNPLDALKQKVADEGITEPVLADESMSVSRAYNAMAYGMMAGSADGHTFILVGPDGRIRWRADYGGPPNYTMFVPVDNLLADIKAGVNGN